MPARSEPVACLHRRPNIKSIKFGGRYINLTLLAERGGFTHGYLSYIFACEKTPSLSYARRIAEQLGMNMDSFLAALDERKSMLDAEMRRRLA